MIQYSRGPQDQFKAEDYTIGWSWRLFIFSLIIFVAVALLYVGMLFGYLPTLRAQIDEVKKKTDDINNSISTTDKEKLFNFYSQVFHIQNVLQHHPLPSKLFTFLENYTNKNVFFTSLNFSEATSILAITGVAVSYDDLVGQLEAFRQRSEVMSVILSSSENDAALLRVIATNKGVTFVIKLSFDKNFFNQP